MDKVTFYLNDKEDLDSVSLVLESHHGNLENIRFIKLRDVQRNAWIRDFGPVYLYNQKGQKQIVDFNYFGKSLSFNEQIASLKNIPYNRSSLNSSGGARVKYQHLAKSNSRTVMAHFILKSLFLFLNDNNEKSYFQSYYNTDYTSTGFAKFMQRTVRR